MRNPLPAAKPRVFALAGVILASALAGCVVDPPKDVDPPPVPPPEVVTAAERDDAPEPERPPQNASAPPPPPEAPPEPPVPTPPAPPAPAARTERYYGNVTGAGVATEAAYRWASSEPSTHVTTVSPGTTALLVELRWTAEAAADFDFDLVLKAPDYEESAQPEVTPNPASPTDTEVATWTGHRWMASDGMPGAPDRVLLLIEDPEALALVGTWTVELGPKGPAAAAYELAVTHVQWGPIADGFTAFA